MNAVAIILAAGAGRRMGGIAKAALRLPDGRSFLEAILHTASVVGVRPVVVVAEPFGAMVAALVGAQAAIAWNRAPEAGMISSICVGLELVAAAEVALIWPVDQPLIGAGTVRTVLAAAAPNRIVVPCHDGRGGHPSAFGSAFFGALAVAPTARAVIEAEFERVVRIAVDDAAIVQDVDTPADLARVRT